MQTIKCALFVGVVALAGCASSLVGLQSDGSYKLESSELTSSCDAMHKNFNTRVDLLKMLPAKLTHALLIPKADRSIVLPA